MNKKILIVGGCGYIGGFLTDFLSSKKNYSVTVYDNLLFENRFLKNCNFVFGDIRDYDKVASIASNFDIVIWLAGLVGDGACSVDPDLTNELNVNAFVKFVDSFSGKIVFPSTCSVYGVNNELIDEKAEPNPLSLYASTKLEAERYVLEKRPDSLVFRLGTLFGLGDNHSRLRLDLVANILTKKATLGEELTVFGGEQWRPLLHVRDVSTAIDHCLTKNVSGLYNLSYENFTIKDLAKDICKEINCNIKYIDMKFEDLRNYRVSNKKILATGWSPCYNIQDGIQQIQEVIKENRIKDTQNSVYSNAQYIKEIYG
jgi:nucleoside-diphosphate-sugar epimerase